jgi:arabinogalactan oligomer / maltooligosaccharide transport system substrate-binding protein
MNQPLRLAALAATVAIAAAACGQGGGTPAASTAASAPAATAAALSGKLTVWHSYGSSGGGAESAEVKALNQILAALKTKYPDLTIDAINVKFDDLYKNFENESGTGGGPDMFIGPNDNLGNEVRGGYLEDLTGKIDDVLAASSDVSKNGSTVDGKPYMVPESLKAVAMYYDSAKVPTPPKTTDELMTFVKGGGKVGILTGAYFGWGFYSAFGGQILDASGKCTATANSGVADAIKYVADLNAAGALVDSSYDKVNNAFKAGDVDIMLNGNWTLGDYKTARPSLGVAAFPSGPAGPGKSMTGVDGWYINAAGKNIDLAIAVAKELVSAESQAIEVSVAGHVPANKSVTASDPLVKAFTDAILQGDPRPQSKQFGNYWGPFGDAWSKAIPDDESAGGDPTALVATACTTMDAAPQ